MTLAAIVRYGKERLVIDIQFTQNNKTQRYRRESAVACKMLEGLSTAATKTAMARIREDARKAAEEEHQAILNSIAKHGAPQPPEAAKVPTFGEVVNLYLIQALPKLKPSTQAGYKQILDKRLAQFSNIPIDAQWGNVLADLDTSLLKEGLAETTRNNVQRVARAVLTFAFDRRILVARADRLPPLKVARGAKIIPTAEEVDLILAAASTAQTRLALAFLAFAGLRPSELRALRWQDLKELETEGAKIQVRRAMVHGIEVSPKTGPRPIPFSHRLAPLLPRKGKAEDFVSLTRRGTNWEDASLNREMKKIVKRLGLNSALTAYSLRHYAITSWLRALIPTHVVMVLAGHSNLSTTQGYAHALGLDLDQASKVIRGFGTIADPSIKTVAA